VTLLVAVPLLVASLILVARGSIRAIPVWIGVLFYTLYMYAYAVFGATFNDAFLLHIAAFSISMFALACALPAIDLDAVAQEFAATGGRRRSPSSWWSWASVRARYGCSSSFATPSPGS
jgi:hypothetical protein